MTICLSLATCGSDSTATVRASGERTDTASGSAPVRERWITEAATPPVGAESDVPASGISGDPAPQEVAPSRATREWIAQIEAALVESDSTWEVTRLFDVGFTDRDPSVSVARVRSTAATLAISRQQLVEPLAILPDAGTPGVDQLGTYERRPDGSELLIINSERYVGSGSPSDYHFYYATPSGMLTDINYLLIPGPQGSMPPPNLSLENLVQLAVSEGEAIK